MLCIVADAERSSGGMTVLAVLAAMVAWQFSVVLIVWRVFRWDGADGDDAGPGGDGPGWRRLRRPRKPPPDDPVCLPEFERQFAEHVAALAAGERTPSRPRGDRAGDQ